MIELPSRRDLIISKGWIQAAILIFLLGFFVLGMLAHKTYTGEPPIPRKVVDPSGNPLSIPAKVNTNLGSPFELIDCDMVHFIYTLAHSLNILRRTQYLAA